MTSANGFVSFNNVDSRRVPINTQIFNPNTRDMIQLPAISYPSFLYHYRDFVLGVDSCSGEHKVVYFFLDPYMKKIEIHVFTVGSSSNSWRILQNVPDIACWVFSIAYVNGSFHWLTMEDIVRLDIASEKFTTIAYPLPVKDYDIKIFDMTGFLTLVAVASSYCDPRPVEVWIMKEYNVVESWTRILIEKTPSCLCGMSIQSIRPFSLDKNGEMLIVYEDRIVAYNKGCYTLVYLHNKDGELLTLPINGRCIFPFTENLLPVQRLLQN